MVDGLPGEAGRPARKLVEGEHGADLEAVTIQDLSTEEDALAVGGNCNLATLNLVIMKGVQVQVIFSVLVF